MRGSRCWRLRDRRQLHLDAFKRTVQGKARLGVEIFANALLVVPKTLLENSGVDIQDKLLKVIGERESKKLPVGINVATGDPLDATIEGIWDNYCVKKQLMGLASILAQQSLMDVQPQFVSAVSS